MTAMTVTTARPGSRSPAAPAGAVPRLGPVPRCPRCTAVLDGGPVVYHCGPCGRGVMAADIDTDYHPPAPPRASTRTQGGAP